MNDEDKDLWKVREQRLELIGQHWLGALVDLGLAALWVSAIATRKVADVVDRVARRLDPQEIDNPSREQGT